MTLKIRYVQSGGFGGLIRRCTIDAAALAPAAAPVLKRLVKAAPLAELKTARTEGAADLTSTTSSSRPTPGRSICPSTISPCRRR